MKLTTMPTEDLELILDRGVFEVDDSRYCILLADGGIALSAAGRRLLRVSCLIHFCDPAMVDQVNSIGSLRKLTRTIDTIKAWRESDALHLARTGELPVEAAELAKAAVEGPRELHRATARRLRRLESAQRINNVLFFFRRRGDRSSSRLNRQRAISPGNEGNRTAE